MKIYNTLSKKVEELIPNEPGKIKMYTCGPTVYHYAHIGNLRTYIFEDIFEKTLKYIGYEVTRCMNITDVGHLTSDSDSGEDKMLKGARREHKTVLEIADYYTQEFKKDCEKLNIRWPDIVSPATNNIDEYIKIIEKLLEKGLAYISGGNVYYDTSKLEDYYVLTNHKEDEMVVGVRDGVEEDLSKKNQADFVLWFTKSKFEDYRELVRKRVSEFEKRDIHVMNLDQEDEEKLRNLKTIGGYLDRTIEEHQKILSNHMELKDLYTKELEDLTQVASIKRFSIKNEVYDKVLEKPDSLENLNVLLSPLFRRDAQKEYNLEKILQPHKVIRRKKEENITED